MNTKFSNIVKLSIFSLILFQFIGCDNDKPNPTPEPKKAKVIKYGIATVSGAFPKSTTYIQGLENIDSKTIDNKNAKELAASASVISFGKDLYATPFGSPAKLVKYSFDKDGKTNINQTIIVPGSTVFSSVLFKNETLAYATVAGNISKLITFDPTTMRITDEINLKDIKKKFPEATRVYYQSMVEQDGKLFVSVYYEKNFKPFNHSAYIAVIDVKTKKVEKIIEDKRTGMLFGGQAVNSGVIKTSNGDIYFQGKGTDKVPSGLLRIKKGTTEFDKDYFFNLKEKTGKTCYGIYLVNSKFYTARVEDETDFWEYINKKPQFKYYEIDVTKQTSIGAVKGLPTTFGSRRMIITPLGADETAFTIATETENALYRLKAGKMEKVFDSKGGYIAGFNLLK